MQLHWFGDFLSKRPSVHVAQENDITWSHLLTIEKEDLEKVTLQ